MSVKQTTKIILAHRSGDRCAFPGCGKELTVDGTSANPVVTGEVAHIAGEKAGSARHNPSMTEDERNHYNNLIYLCGNCHTRIDKQETVFPVQRLLDMKTTHELTVREAMTEVFSDIGFPELEEATQWILRVEPSHPKYDYSLIPPDDKLKKNELGYTFRPRASMNREGKLFTSFAPAVSDKAAKAMRQRIRRWRLHHRSDLALAEVARWAEPVLRGWARYYARFYPSKLREALRTLDRFLIRWAQRKYKRLRRHYLQAWEWLHRLKAKQPTLFAHWHPELAVGR